MSTETHQAFDQFSEYAEVAHLAGRSLADLIAEVQEVYLMDQRPWVVGFSGGKDSTVVAQLVYHAVATLPQDQKKKPVFVISSDTLVETPMVTDLISGTLARLGKQAKKNGLPISGHMVYPKTGETFWVNLIGKGYPAPTTQFRWCTERMKINPVSDFIKAKVSEYGEVVIILGSRSQESATRAHVMKKHRIAGSRLSRHSDLPSAYIYPPIANWTHDEVWDCLLSAPQPWGGTNEALFQLYKGSNDGECPLVIDTNTPSCGNSRFGCWTCTVVTKERAIEGLINSGETWLKPLQEFRNFLYQTTIPENKKIYRNIKRRTGVISYKQGPIDKDGNSDLKHIPGPYWMKYRQDFLRQILTIQKDLDQQGKDVTLISKEELHKIRKEWIHDPNEPDWEDSLPTIYNEIFDNQINWVENDAGSFSQEDIGVLRGLEKKYDVPAEMVVRLIQVETSMDGLSRRSGITKKLETILSQDWAIDEAFATRRDQAESHMGFAERLSEVEGEASEVNRELNKLSS
jgi:DNA sulfur modification protein DndC